MNLTVVLSLACAIIGVVLYLVAAPAKPSEVGRLMFACGLLAFLLTFSGTLSIAAR